MPEQFLQWKHLFKKFDSFVKNYKISKLEACMGYANFKEIDKFVIGIKNSMELEKINKNLKKIDQFPSFSYQKFVINRSIELEKKLTLMNKIKIIQFFKK